MIFDKLIPVKIIFMIGHCYNNYFIEAKYAAPSPSWLDFSNLQRNLLNNCHNIILPLKVKKALEPKKKKNNNNPPSRTGTDKRTNGVMDNHKNQPPQLKCTRDMYHNCENTCILSMK